MRRVSMIVAATLAVITIGPASAQNNWTNFGQDPGATKFSTLDQINVDNVRNLKRATMPWAAVRTRRIVAAV